VPPKAKKRSQPQRARRDSKRSRQDAAAAFNAVSALADAAALVEEQDAAEQGEEEVAIEEVASEDAIEEVAIEEVASEDAIEEVAIEEVASEDAIEEVASEEVASEDAIEEVASEEDASEEDASEEGASAGASAGAEGSISITYDEDNTAILVEGGLFAAYAAAGAGGMLADYTAVLATMPAAIRADHARARGRVDENGMPVIAKRVCELKDSYRLTKDFDDVLREEGIAPSARLCHSKTELMRLGVGKKLLSLFTYSTKQGNRFYKGTVRRNNIVHFEEDNKGVAMENFSDTRGLPFIPL
jgi:hypothetical protein